MKVPQKQPKRRRLWLNDGSCIRLRPEHKDHVWSYDFVMARTSDGRAFRILTVLDEYTRECLAIVHLASRTKATGRSKNVAGDLQIVRNHPTSVAIGPENQAWARSATEGAQECH